MDADARREEAESPGRPQADGQFTGHFIAKVAAQPLQTIRVHPRPSAVKLLFGAVCICVP